jgi:Putative metallopeptidase
MPYRHRVSIEPSVATMRVFAPVAAARFAAAPFAAAFCLLACATTPGLAQPAAPAEAIPIPPPSTFQTRIEAAALAAQANPRLKGLTQQQRVDRFDFVVGNTLVLLLHEVGHVLIAEFQLRVLGREEDAADTYAALTMLSVGTSFTVLSLADAAKGWFFDARRDQEIGGAPLYYDEHNVSAQRAYQIVCLMVGSDPEKFKSLADQAKMPEERQKSCKRDYRKASEAWGAVLAPHVRRSGQPETQINVVYGDGKGTYDVLANLFRSIRFLETVAEAAQGRYLWPYPWTIAMQSCGRPGADYDTDTRTVTMCYEQALDFAELYRAYVPVKPAAVPAANTRKTKSR